MPPTEGKKPRGRTYSYPLIYPPEPHPKPRLQLGAIMPEEDLSASLAAYAVETPPIIIASRQLERPYQLPNSQLAQSSGLGFRALCSVLCWHEFHHSCCRLSIGMATMAQACLAVHIVLQDFNWSHCPPFPVANATIPLSFTSITAE
jgi:hypothetical protein